MEIDWRQWQWDGYARDATYVLQRFLNGEREPAFLARILDLVHTYVDATRCQVNTSLADDAMIVLTRSIQQHVQDLGLWQQIFYLWPHVADVALQAGDFVSHFDLLKHVAILKDRLGDWPAAQTIYDQLTTSSSFHQLPVTLQVDLLHHAGTGAVWQGELAQAHRLLTHCLTITEQNPSPLEHRNQNDQFGIRIAYDTIAMWEVKAYTLNQLGVLAMFQGQFTAARRWFDACLAEFVAHGEADNLACVAYQAIGRLFLHCGQIAQAIPILEKGVELRTKRRELEGVAVNSMYLAAAYTEANQAGRAEGMLNEALLIFRELGNQRDTGLCHLYFGQLEMVYRHPQAALDQWRQALACLQVTSTPVVEQRVLIRYLPWLLWRGHWQLLVQTIHQLIRSARQQNLGIGDLLCLLFQLRWQWQS